MASISHRRLVDGLIDKDGDIREPQLSIRNRLTAASSGSKSRPVVPGITHEAILVDVQRTANELHSQRVRVLIHLEGHGRRRGHGEMQVREGRHGAREAVRRELKIPGTGQRRDLQAPD